MSNSIKYWYFMQRTKLMTIVGKKGWVRPNVLIFIKFASQCDTYLKAPPVLHSHPHITEFLTHTQNKKDNNNLTSD